MNDHLYSNCLVCRDTDCKDAVKQSPSGRWYITMGHAGFNTKANNGNGYNFKSTALKVMKKHTGRN